MTDSPVAATGMNWKPSHPRNPPPPTALVTSRARRPIGPESHIVELVRIRNVLGIQVALRPNMGDVEGSANLDIFRAVVCPYADSRKSFNSLVWRKKSKHSYK